MALAPIESVGSRASLAAVIFPLLTVITTCTGPYWVLTSGPSYCCVVFGGVIFDGVGVAFGVVLVGVGVDLALVGVAEDALRLEVWVVVGVGVLDAPGAPGAAVVVGALTTCAAGVLGSAIGGDARHVGLVREKRDETRNGTA